MCAMPGRMHALQGALRHSREHFNDAPTFGVSPRLIQSLPHSYYRPHAAREGKIQLNSCKQFMEVAQVKRSLYP